MVIGVGSWDLSLPECRSLKEKRRVVKSLKERLQHRFRVSVAETDHQDTWTRAQLTAAVVASDRAQADSILDSLDRFVVQDGRTVILNVDRSFR
ncbi:MAG: DUF503 domain-containing protein [Gemmatimonadota bacterium]|jgi:uncharacterized protein YlxP (DUF503 family)